MPLENAERFMETIKCNVVQIDEKVFIKISLEGNEIKVPLSEDRPNEVKSSFNKLIEHLRDGLFQIELEEIGDDLFSQVAAEYIAQLNRELQEVYGEMQNYGLITSQ